MKTPAEAAARYIDLGFQPIPLRADATPARGFLRKGPNAFPRNVLDWFQNPDVAGVGIATGSGLGIMDFDCRRLYDDWAQRNPALAALLPTVPTVKGVHLYHRSPPGSPTRRKPGSWDYLGEGSYAVAPCSRHRLNRDFEYRFVNPLRDDLPTLDPSIFGVSPRPQTVPPTAPSDVCSGTHEVFGGESRLSSTLLLCPNLETVEEAIRATIPSGPGQRHYQVFALARRLKAIRRDFSEPELRRIAGAWFKLARPYILTQDVRVTEDDLVEGYKAVRFAHGTTFAAAVALAEQDAYTVPGVYQTEALHRAARLFRALAKVRHGEPFHLSVRDLAKRAGCSRMSAHRFAERLVSLEVVERVEPGVSGAKSRTAATWRWRGG